MKAASTLKPGSIRATAQRKQRFGKWQDRKNHIHDMALADAELFRSLRADLNEIWKMMVVVPRIPIPALEATVKLIGRLNDEMARRDYGIDTRVGD